MENLIMAKDVVNIEGAQKINKNNITAILLNRSIYPVKKIGQKNLFNKKQIEKSFKDNPYEPHDKKKYKESLLIIIDRTKYLLSKDIQEIYADRLPKSAVNNFSSWAKLRGLKPDKKIKINSRTILNAFSIVQVESFLANKEKKKRNEDCKIEEKRNIDCINYLSECLPKAAIKNKKIKCNNCKQYQKKEFNYYEATN